MVDGRLECKTQSILGEMWQEACQRGSSLGFKIVSGSMGPMIQVGDVVRVRKVEPSRVRIGDILAFKNGQNVLVHRIIGKSRSSTHLTFREMGDAGAASRKIAAKDIIGKVTVIEKEGREIQLDSRRHIIGNRVLGWRLLLADNLRRMQPRYISIVIRLALRPTWRLCRGLLFWRL